MSEPVRTLEDTETSKVDIAALMSDIREKIKADMEKHRDERITVSPLAGKFVDAQGIKFGDLQHAENLRYLNTSYAFETALTPDSVVTHRTGLLGKLIVKCKRTAISFIRNSILAPYLAQERAFVEHLVRHVNDIGRYVDARDARISRDLELMIRRIDDEKTHTLSGIETGFEQRLAHVDAMVRGLEGIINNLGAISVNNPPTAPTAEANGEPTPPKSYLLLENRYRGSEAEIEKRLAIYPRIFSGAKGPVLEIGSGRGELQRLLRAAKIDSYGVDLDTVMVNVANSNGCKTLYGDGISHLRSVADRSLGGLVAIQVVEHLSREQLSELCDLAKRKVRQGGRIAFETINPQSMLALSSNYFRDPTHVWPMHPDTLGYMATLAGLKIVETKMLSPVAANHLLREIPIDSSHTPAIADALSRLNRNISQLNGLLYGYQDYCLILEA